MLFLTSGLEVPTILGMFSCQLIYCFKTIYISNRKNGQFTINLFLTSGLEVPSILEIFSCQSICSCDERFEMYGNSEQRERVGCLSSVDRCHQSRCQYSLVEAETTAGNNF